MFLFVFFSQEAELQASHRRAEEEENVWKSKLSEAELQKEMVKSFMDLRGP